MASIDLIPGFESFSVNEASRRKVHKAAKQGSYPAVIVVVQNGKVIHQEPVSTPDIAPAMFNVMQEKYPKALLHLEDNTGKRLFSESIVTEGKISGSSQEAYRLHILANKVGQEVAAEFLSDNRVDLDLLTKAIQQGTINKYELRDVVDGTAHKFKIKNFMKAFVSESIVTEGAKIETERYVRSHGKKPKGYGGWMFSYNRDGSDEWQIPNGMSWPDAQKWAKKKAKEDGEDYVYVMENESVVIEGEDTIGGLNKMANTDLERIADYADMIKDRMSQGQTLDAWMYSKISDSVKNLNSVHDTMDGNDGVNEAEKHEFNPNETAERLKRREKQNIERYRAAQDREDPFAVQYYQLRVSLDKMDLQRLKIQTQIHQLKQKYKK